MKETATLPNFVKQSTLGRKLFSEYRNGALYVAHIYIRLKRIRLKPGRKDKYTFNSNVINN